MSYQFGEDHPIQANYIGIHTGWDHVGNWKFCGKLSFLLLFIWSLKPWYKGIKLQCRVDIYEVLCHIHC